MLGDIFSVRVGGGALSTSGTVFGMGNFLLGSANHKFEAGAGPILGIGTFFRAGWSLAATTTLGYRYTPADGGMFFKISFTPLIVIGTDSAIFPWGGAGVGYAF
jgi:hypothetical protein